ncbi:tRNA-dihydrouridine(20a/20b) synthase [NAD(P)+]-like protein [Boothiomyces macroporosus]|uniref:tRNA-dihydrouridine synthase n=1 Tax=Boothiomyces macroporosus TaxID=261099 RepID=A0AAD5Y7K3_9FUNG|nr:tRNA-dihydrouridine(20a/20b) synthase [NAD(P)+]-like protein [Boothiomyces macroporosus]
MDEKTEPRLNPKQLLKNGYLKICAPMVRYSKLPFRQLVRDYNVDLCYTPMILADVFKHSQMSRQAEFTTNFKDDPVIVQFAANNGTDAADAAELIAKYSNGVDINCGCPQPWAIGEKIGSYLLSQPETVKDIVDQVKRRTSSVKMQDGSSFPCSIKIRIHEDLNETVELCKRAEAVGVDWITVHGRLKKQKNHEPVNLDALKIMKESVNVPLFTNGGIYNLKEANAMMEYTKADGVMVATGLLQNPALFSGYDYTPIECVEKFINYSVGYGSNHFIFHHHLMFMLENVMSRAEKQNFNALYSIPGVIDYLKDHYGILQ